MTARERRRAGFSLVEVVLAVAVVAGSSIALLALLAKLARNPGDSADARVACAMAAAIEQELARRAQSGFDAFADSIPTMSADAETGLHLVAGRNGANIRERQESESPGRDQYFLIVVRRFGPAMTGDRAPRTFIAANVVVSWPYRIATASGLTPPTAGAERRSVTYNVSLGR